MPTVLFVNGGKGRFAQQFIAACEQRDLAVQTVRAAHLLFHATQQQLTLYTNNHPIDLAHLSFAFLRTRASYPQTAALLLRALEQRGIPHNDPGLAEHQANTEKCMQMILAPHLQLPIPDTWIFSRASFVANQATLHQYVQFPAVLKVDASGGKGVWKVHTWSDVEARLQVCSNEVFLLQTYIPNSADIRVLSVYGRILGAMERRSTDGFYNNAAKGASLSTVQLTTEEQSLVHRACKAFSFDFAGVDIVRTAEGPYLFEVNVGPQIYGFEDTTGIPVCDVLADALAQHIQTRPTAHADTAKPS